MSKVIDFLQINPNFRDLIPPLAEYELEALEAELRYWARAYSPIITWQGTIIDGHHRYEICKRHNLPFKVEEREFEDENDAEIWIIKNQFSRRNLQPYTRATLNFELEKREALKSKRGNNQYTKDKESGSPRFRGEVPRDRDKESNRKAAKASGMGHDTYAKCKFIHKHGSEEDKQKLHKGEVSTSQVYNRIKTEKIREETIGKLESIEAQEAKAIEGVYDVVVIDPPWEITQYQMHTEDNHKPLQYPTMTIEEIERLEIPCANDCHVFLWTTQKFLPRVFEILKHWGFDYRFTITWVKNRGMKPLNHPQYTTEFCICARKGNPKFVSTVGFFTHINAKSINHSEKPEEFYELLRRVTAGRRLDMFNRRNIEGFYGWGNECV